MKICRRLKHTTSWKHLSSKRDHERNKKCLSIEWRMFVFVAEASNNEMIKRKKVDIENIRNSYWTTRHVARAGEKGRLYSIAVGKVEGRDCWDDRDIFRRIISEGILKRCVFVTKTSLILLKVDFNDKGFVTAAMNF